MPTQNWLLKYLYTLFSILTHPLVKQLRRELWLGWQYAICLLVRVHKVGHDLSSSLQRVLHYNLSFFFLLHSYYSSRNLISHHTSLLLCFICASLLVLTHMFVLFFLSFLRCKVLRFKRVVYRFSRS